VGLHGLAIFAECMLALLLYTAIHCARYAAPAGEERPRPRTDTSRANPARDGIAAQPVRVLSDVGAHGAGDVERPVYGRTGVSAQHPQATPLNRNLQPGSLGRDHGGGSAL
jgi:hypothetical protein